MTRASISKIQLNDFNSISRISDACFGLNYITTELLSSMLAEPGIFNKIELENNLIGFCLVQITSGKVKDFEFEIPEIVKEEEIAIVKTIAIHPNYQRKGFGTQLLKQVVQQINSQPTISSVYYPSWIESESDGFSKTVKNEGFKEIKLYQNFWLNDSLKHNYTCIRCGNPPCKCSMQLYRME